MDHDHAVITLADGRRIEAVTDLTGRRLYFEGEKRVSLSPAKVVAERGVTFVDFENACWLSGMPLPRRDREG